MEQRLSSASFTSFILGLSHRIALCLSRVEVLLPEALLFPRRSRCPAPGARGLLWKENAKGSATIEQPSVAGMDYGESGEAMRIPGECGSLATSTGWIRIPRA